MEENKGILKKIQEFLNKVFGINKNKQLQQPDTIEIDSKKENNSDFKKKITVNLENDLDKKELKNISMDENEVFSFPANLRGYTFKTNVVIDENSPKGSYVCSLVCYDETNVENCLPICKNENKEKARIVENTLLGLKAIIDEDYSKDLIKTIIEKGFRLENNEDERFNVTKDYHLSDVLQKILNAKQKDVNIEILVNYLYKLNELNKGYEIIKSNRLIEIEGKQKEEQEKIKNIDYYDMIKTSIIKGRPINPNKLNEDQIKILREYYVKIINDIESEIESDKYIEFGIEYINNLSKVDKDNSKYFQIPEMYKTIEEKLQKSNNSIINVDLYRQQEQLKRIIKNLLIKILNEDLNNLPKIINER